MILQELVLHNFGVYRDRQTLRFAPPSTSSPITLIGGLNGEGKTTLMEGLQLALYGPLGTISGRRGQSFDAYLEGMIHRSAPASEGAGVELAFVVHVSGIAERFRVHRSWGMVSGRMRHRLEVIRNDRLDQDLTERWAEQVEAFVPRGIAPLFFFDAEQVEAFAEFEAAHDLMRTAVGALLGLDLVDRLQGDLLVIERRKRVGKASRVVQAEVSHLQGEVDELSRTEEAARDAAISAQERVDRVRRDLAAITSRFREEGGDLYELRHELEDARSRAQQELRALDGDLRELAAGPTCLLVVLPQLDAASTQASREYDALRLSELAKILAKRDARVLEQLRSMSLPPTVLDRIRSTLKSDRAKGKTKPVPVVADLASDAFVHLRGLLTSSLPEESRRIKELLGKRRATKTALDAVEQKLAAVPSADAIDSLLQERQTVAGEVAAADTALQLASQHLEQVRRNRADRVRRLERFLETSAREYLDDVDSRRIVEHAARVRDTLSRFRIQATRRHLSRIESLILEALGHLLRKQRLVNQLHLDPATLRLDLRDDADRSLDPKKLSAGERQLLAISMLWGLARASGRPLPVVIDTPLGRLDATHRLHLLDRYFPYASHQVVLLSTDDEIDAAAFARLRQHVGRSHRLVFDDAAAATRITDGYFW